MWFDSWSDLLRVVAVGMAAYAILVISLRLTGKRALAQLHAFDLVVTVAIGSVLATILLSSDVSWAEGALALILLLVLQFVVALIGSRWRMLHRAIAAEPTLLVAHGSVIDEAIARHRLARSDLLAAVRGSGAGDLAEVGALVLEANGTMSVIRRENLGDGSALPFPELSERS